jgi:hypothetical protein
MGVQRGQAECWAPDVELKHVCSGFDLELACDAQLNGRYVDGGDARMARCVAQGSEEYVEFVSCRRTSDMCHDSF